MADFLVPQVEVHEATPVDGHNSTRDPCGDFSKSPLANNRRSKPVSFRSKPRSLQLLAGRKPINKRKASRLASPFKPKNQQTRLKHVLRSLRVSSVQTGGVAGIKDFALQMIQKFNLQDNFYAIDLGRLERLYKAFQAAMPRVRPFYAVKCNPDKGLVAVLASLGAGFDCASKGEMSQILEAGVSPADIIFAHPCKRPACLDHAASQNILKMTFDSESELEKIAARCPNAKCVLRIKADDPDAVVVFGAKYGAHPYEEAPRLLAAAKRLNMNVIGVSFHVGSGSQHAEAYANAIAAARHVFDLGRALNFNMDFLDIGGGFFGRFDSSGEVQIHTVADAVNAALTQHFPVEDGVTVIAEPGRYFAEACCTLFCMVHTVKETRTQLDGPAVGRSYFITDGVYGSFNAMIYDHCAIRSSVLRSPMLPPADTGSWAPTTVFGPTCDGIDLIYKQVQMPLLRAGDWLQFPEFGAYSVAGACPFNGLPVDEPTRFYVWSKAVVDKAVVQSVDIKRGSAAAMNTPEARIRFVGDVHDLDIVN